MSTSILVISSLVGSSFDDISYPFVFDEIYRLANRGFEVHVARMKLGDVFEKHGIHYHNIRSSFEPGILKFILGKIKHYPLISLFRGPRPLYVTCRYAFNVQRIVEQEKIDIIHAHFAYIEGWVGYLAKLSVKKPLVVTTHGYDIQVVPEIEYGARLDRKLDVLIRKVLNNADAISVPSTSMYKKVLDIVGDEEKVFLIPNGVDINIFTPTINKDYARKLIKVDEDQHLVFTARHHRPVYGIEFLIKAIPFVVRKIKNVKFIIGGDGPLRIYHENLARQLNLEDHVIFSKYIPRSLMPYYFAASDIVVVPSLQEAFGLLITEAMASGKPVIGTNVGGIPDQIIDGYNGFLVEPKDPQAIAVRITYLIRNPEEAKRMGMNGRRLAEDKFDINKRIDKIINLYQKIVGHMSI
ncbi:MAG: glycosyltransferase family 4 protein [Thermoproteota archaeon]